MKVFYFAYGSNMDRDRIRKRGVTVLSEEIGILKNWALTFNKKADSGNNGYANIVNRKGSKVIGVLYKIREEDLQKLDNYEGVPTHYFRTKIAVEIAGGKTTEAYVYIAQKNMTSPNLRPSSTYLSYLIEGANQHNFPKDYVEFLEKFMVNQNEPNRYP